MGVFDVNRRVFGTFLAGSFGAALTDVPALAKAAGSLEIEDAYVEWRKNAQGIDTFRPRFRWTLRAAGEAHNKTQAAFRLRISDYIGQPVFDSGMQMTDALRFMPSIDVTLHSQRRYDWFLTVWDERGQPSAEIHVGNFVTGILTATKRSGSWIAAEPQGAPYVQTTWAVHPDSPHLIKPPIFRKRFDLAGKPVSAVLSLAGLGQYRLYVNGTQVSPNAMNGAWTDYSKRVLYDTYDVSQIVTSKENWLAVELGNGFFNVEGAPDRYRKYVGRFGPPQLWLQLHLIFADLREEEIVSDESWLTREGATIFTNIYGGEDYDARKNIRGWQIGKGTDEGWRRPDIVPGPTGALQAHTMTPMKSFRLLQAKLLGEPKPGVYVYDFSVNHSGRPILSVFGRSPGRRIILRPSELLAEDGTVDQGSMTRWAEHSTVIAYNFTSAGAAREQWEPAFTYNGYRYMQVEGVHSSDIEALESDFLTDNFVACGEFACSDERLNRIHGLIKQAVLSNAASYLTDCPDREKVGWMEQSYLNSDAVLMNIDAGALYEKLSFDFADAQLSNGMEPSFAPEYLRFVDEKERDADLRDSPEWAAATVLTPWAAYGLYGDTESLAKAYPTMQRYAHYILTRVAPDGLISFGIGDWYDFGPNAPGPAQLTSLKMSCTATIYYVFRSLAQIAALLGKPEAHSYSDCAEKFRASIIAHLYDQSTHQFDRGSQTANAMALALDIAPPDARQAVLENLIRDIRSRNNHVSAGDIGFHYVVWALSKFSRGDVLYEMLQRTDSPSYGEQLASGATSLTEAWNGERVSSQNHFMLGHIERWFYRGLGGISVDLTAMVKDRIVIAPDWFCGVQGAAARYRSVFGWIGCDWKVTGKRWVLKVEIPHGTHAAIYFPDKECERKGSGRYVFSGEMPNLAMR